MESFSLLKYWKGGGVAGVSFAGDAIASVQTTTTPVTVVSDQPSESDEEDNADGGSFFDLEFTVPDENNGNFEGEIDDIICLEENEEEKDESTESDDDQSDGENDTEVKFTFSSASSGDGVDPNVSLSPSDDLFFKGRLVPLSEPNSKPSSLLKSATKSTKFRVLMLKLKKSTKSNVSEKVKPDESAPENPKQRTEKEKEKKKQSKLPGKFFSVKFKVEVVPIMSLFTKDNNSKIVNNKTQKKNDKLGQDERGFSKEALQKYLKKVKPLYVRVSKRYGEKLGFPGHLSLLGVAKSPPAANSKVEAPKVSEAPRRRNVRTHKQVSLPARLRVVRKHLGKSKSASSAVAVAASSAVALAASSPGPVVSKRRDYSLLQQQDGIQSAIMHCKRSFKACRESESSGLLRSVTDQSQEKSLNLSTADSSISEDKSKGELNLKA